MSYSDQKFVVIPVVHSYPAYQMKVTLDGTVYQLYFYFNDRMGYWMMQIQDQNGSPLIDDIPMLPGYPLNWRYAQRIPGTPPGIFYVVDETGQNRIPNRTNFGSDVNLYYLQEAS